MASARISRLPLPWTRLFLSTMTLCMSIVAGAVTVQLFIKGHKQKHFLKSHVPAGVSISVDNNDIKGIGIGVLLASSLLSSASSNPLLFLLQDMFHVIPPTYVLPWGLKLPSKLVSTTTLPMQAYSMLVTTLAVIATMVPFTIFARQREAKVIATMAGMQLSDASVMQIEQALGTSTVYWQTSFIRLVAIAPWTSLLFSIPLTIVSFVALARKSPTEAAPSIGDASAPLHLGATEEVSGSLEKVV